MNRGTQICPPKKLGVAPPMVGETQTSDLSFTSPTPVPCSARINRTRRQETNSPFHFFSPFIFPNFSPLSALTLSPSPTLSAPAPPSYVFPYLFSSRTGTNVKVGAHVRPEKKFCCRALHFVGPIQIQTVVLVSDFVMVSTVWSSFLFAVLLLTVHPVPRRV